MDNHKALEILSALADGVDPMTGGVLEKESVLHQPNSIRALHHAVSIIGRIDKTERALAARSGTGWSREEDTQLCRQFRDNVDFADIAVGLGRTRSEIYARLVTLGKVKTKIPPRSAA